MRSLAIALGFLEDDRKLYLHSHEHPHLSTGSYVWYYLSLEQEHSWICLVVLTGAEGLWRQRRSDHDGSRQEDFHACTQYQEDIHVFLVCRRREEHRVLSLRSPVQENDDMSCDED